jgi:DNA-binding IclR family transcriptional regulator
MSTADPIMDAADMRDADWEILRVLRAGRANAPYIAEQTGYSAQYIRERLGRLKQDDLVEPLGHGLYSINEKEVPEREDDR